MADDQITELTELEATKVSGVTSPANGTPFLLLKAAATEDCPTCSGSGKIREGNVQCPDCKGTGNLAKDRAGDGGLQDELEDLIGEALKGAWCGNLDCEVCGAAKANLSADDRKGMPAAAFAYVDSDGGKHLPVHDEGHVKAAIGRFGQQDFTSAENPDAAKKNAAKKILAAAKQHGVDVSDDTQVAQAAKSTGVPVGSTATPEARPAPDDLNVHSADGKSGVVGPLATGPATPPEVYSIPGGETTQVIPLDAQTREHQIPLTTDGAGIIRSHPTERAGKAAATLIEAIAELEQQRDAVKDGTPSPTLDEQQTPGDPAWEGYDAKTLTTVSTSLAELCATLDHAAEREQTEGETADPGDFTHALELEEAGRALDYALGVVARLAVLEAQEASKTSSTPESAIKVGRRLSGKTVQALQAARDHLVDVLGDQEDTGNGADADTDDGAKKAGTAGSTASEEVIKVADVTKQELAELISAGSAAAAVAAVQEMQKNANNGGDVDTADVKPNGEIKDPADIGGAPDPKFVNKEDGDAPEAEAVEKATQVQLEELTKQVGDLTELVGKIARRPRPGGPIVDGQPRFAVEGRQEDTAVKSTVEVERLEKQLEEAKDPQVRSQLGEQLTHLRFRQAHEQGLI